MAGHLDSLVLDLLEWIGAGEKPYSEVMEAWRTSCPRLTVWEDANERGFVERRFDAGQGAFVRVTPTGREFLLRRPAQGHTEASPASLD